jgi:cytochrome P460
MKGIHRYWPYAAALLTVFVTATWTIRALESAVAAPPAGQSSRAPQGVMPQYDKSGALLLPEDYRRWVMVGASLGISYSEGPATHDMFAHTLMEPTAYRHFVETGTFREGTMFALLLQGPGDKVLPARRGQFANEVHGVEMAVKDSSHVPEGWAYYGFGGMGGAIRSTAKAEPKNSCFSCHTEHAARDHVFLQFYPLLTEAAASSKSR